MEEPVESVVSKVVYHPSSQSTFGASMNDISWGPIYCGEDESDVTQFDLDPPVVE
jgi:hypothetical protein